MAIMSTSSNDSSSTLNPDAAILAPTPIGKPQDWPPLSESDDKEIDEMMDDLLDSMRILSTDEARRKEIEKRLV
jgi:hypothetical protein